MLQDPMFLAFDIYCMKPMHIEKVHEIHLKMLLHNHRIDTMTGYLTTFYLVDVVLILRRQVNNMPHILQNFQPHPDSHYP